VILREDSLIRRVVAKDFSAALQPRIVIPAHAGNRGLVHFPDFTALHPGYKLSHKRKPIPSRTSRWPPYAAIGFFAFLNNRPFL